MDATGNLTKKGHEQAARAFENYVRYGTAPNGRMRMMFSMLHDRLKDLWLRIRPKVSTADGFDIPEDLRNRWDAILRPDHHITQSVVKVMEDTQIQNTLPFIVLDQNVIDRVIDGKVQLLQQKKTAMMADARVENVQQALGVSPGDSVNPMELLAKILAYTQTEQIRRQMDVNDLQAMTMRTVVPKGRAKSIIDRMNHRFRSNVIDEDGGV